MPASDVHISNIPLFTGEFTGNEKVIVEGGSTNITTLITLRSYFTGSAELLKVKDSDLFTITDSSGLAKTVKLSTISAKLLGTKVVESVEDNYTFRMVGSDGIPVSASLGTVSNYLDAGTGNISDFEATEYSIYLKRDEDNSKCTVKMSAFRDTLLGSVEDSAIKPKDRLFYLKSDGKTRNQIQFSNIVSAIIPEVTVINSGIDVNTKLLSVSNDGSRSWADIKGVVSYVVEAINLPTYETTDTLDAPTCLISFQDKSKYGYMSVKKLGALINSSDKITVPADDTYFQATNGILSYGILKDTILKAVDGKIGVDASNSQSNCNDGDSFIFVVNGDKGLQFKNMSYLTLKDKIVGSDKYTLFADLNDNTEVLLKDGYTKLGDIKRYIKTV